MTRNGEMMPDDAVQVTVQMDLTHNDPDSPWPTGYSYALPCGKDGAASTAAYLRELADAIEHGRAFGFMMQEAFNCPAGAGELRPIDHDDTIPALDEAAA